MNYRKCSETTLLFKKNYLKPQLNTHASCSVTTPDGEATEVRPGLGASSAMAAAEETEPCKGPSGAFQGATGAVGGVVKVITI